MEKRRISFKVSTIMLLFFLLIFCYVIVTVTFILSGSTPQCDHYLWTTWGPWSSCRNINNKCTKAQFRSCTCDSLEPQLPKFCETELGGNQYRTEYCDESKCKQFPTSQIETYPFSQLKYLMEIPAYGPNNQYIGMKESMLIAKYSGRIFATPDFYSHSGDIHSFESTFDWEPMNEYVQTIDLQNFVLECNFTIDLMVWMRWSQSHKGQVDSYLNRLNLKVKEELQVSPDLEREERPFLSYDEIRNFFSEYEDKKCIALACPFRNIWFAENERQQMAKYVHHTKEIKNLAQNAIKEMGDPKNLLCYHWRFGEDSCAIFKEPQMDFCWGTSIFCWAKLDDVLSVLHSVMNKSTTRSLIPESTNKVLYLAISTTFNPISTLNQLQSGFSKFNITIKRSTQIPLLLNIADNYYLSLVEQEICGISNSFIASSYSTWSDYIVDWFVVTNKSEHVYSMNQLFLDNGKTFVEKNLVHEINKIYLAEDEKNKKD